MGWAYYNDTDERACAWLRELIKAGEIPDGEIDSRSIADVRAEDVRHFSEAHFFAGIGIWARAKRDARADHGERTVWTASCPCQPFSGAGKKKGLADERHLWPDMFQLIRECAPDRIYGEQVASKDGLAWLDIVCADLENAHYAVGAFDLCAAGFGAPHIRQRLYFVADAYGGNASAERKQRGGRQRQLAQDGGADVMANADSEGKSGRRVQGSGKGDQTRTGAARERSAGLRSLRELADADDARLEGRRQSGRECTGELPAGADGVAGDERPGPLNGFWRSADWLFCRDDKWRPVEPGTFPLADGPPGRVGLLRGYGNAIVLPQAIAFIEEAHAACEDVSGK